MGRIALDTLDGQSFDVAVIGAGANGASAAQHLASAGYSVLLIDKGDFACGASGHSSRILHCGLRYLATGSSLAEILAHPARFATACRMAREAMCCRAEFAAATPERMRHFTLCFPIFRDHPYRPWHLDSAFRLLAALAPKTLDSKKAPLDYRRLKPQDARDTLPFAKWLRDADKLRGIASYREYQFDWPERIVTDTALDAERLGALVRNYTALTAMTRRRDGPWALKLRDTAQGDGEVEVNAKIVLNMAGIWIDRVNALSGIETRRKITGTKGIHVAVQMPPEFKGYGIGTFGRDAWPFYCLPWRDLHYFGPTETLFEGDPDDIRSTDEEIDWVLGEANYLFPGLEIRRENIVYTWACVRPLTYDPELLPRGKRSREIHDLGPDGLPNVFALTAGPIMTHRSTGKALCRNVARRLEPTRPARSPSYGSRAISEEPRSGPLRDNPEVTLAQLRHAAEFEQVSNLIDLLFHRVEAGWSRTMAHGDAREAARGIADILGWHEERIEAEVRRYHSHLETRHGPGVGMGAIAPVSLRDET